MADEIFKLDENGALALNTILSNENSATPFNYDEVFTLDTEGKVAIRVVGTSGSTPASGGGKLVGFVNSSSTRFPPAQRLDYVRVDSTETHFPFTVRGITFNNVNDSAIFTGTQWVKYSFIAETDALEVSTPADESLAGNKTTQKAINIENKEAIENLRKIIDTMFHFVGYVSPTAPTGDIKDGMLWYESAVLPTTFPIQVHEYKITSGVGSWSTTTVAYNPSELDLWSNLNDNQGYYWFANDWNKIDANIEYFKIVHTFTGVDGDERTLYYLDTSYDTYKVGFYAYKEATNKFILLSGDSDVFVDVDDDLPTTNIDNQKIYRLHHYRYTLNGQVIESLDSQYANARPDDLVIDSTGMHFRNSLADIGDWLWADITYAQISEWEFAEYISQVSEFDYADIFGVILPESLAISYVYKDDVSRELVYDLYHNPTQTTSGWLLIGGDNGDIFLDVASLPITNINDQIIYRTNRYKYTQDGVEIPEPTGYVIIDGALQLTADGIEDESSGEVILYTWDMLSDTLVAEWEGNQLVEETTFEDADFFKGENGYFSASSAGKELVWELYYNPTKDPADYQMIGNSGGTGDVLVDNVTVQKIGGKLQANAIIDVAMLPTANIKANTIYRIVETTPIRMVKLYTYENGTWINHSKIAISQENYDLLTTAQKNDGTIYIIDDLAQYLIQFTYRTLADKPSINGITLLDALTLDDLGIYSKDQIDAFLADKAQAEFVDELPPTLQHQVWYYSKKFEDGTLVPNDKRALYIYDDNDVLQFMGVVGEVDLSDYVAKENIQTGLDNDFFYRYTNASTDYYTRTSAAGDVTVYAMTFAGQKVTAITAQSESGTIADDTLTFGGTAYDHNANGDGFYVVNGTDKVVATSALSAVLDKAGRVNDVKLNDKSLVENKEAKLVGLDTIENNYFYKWANGTNYRYTKTKAIGSGVDVYTITFSGSEVDTITKDSATGVIAMAANGADLQLTQSSNTYILDNSYTASKYYIVGAKEKLLTAGVVEEAKDFSKCFEGLYMTPQPESDWKYVGILPASNGSTLKVEDDWKELLFVARVSEGSSYFNLTNVVPKQGFTQGNPNGNNTFIGFFWNESFNCKIRIGLEGTGTNRVVKQNYSNQTGWVLNGTYVYKRG